MRIARYIILLHLADISETPEMLMVGHSCHLKLDLKLDSERKHLIRLL